LCARLTGPPDEVCKEMVAALPLTRSVLYNVGNKGCWHDSTPAVPCPGVVTTAVEARRPPGARTRTRMRSAG
jgi:hypothetical protein